MMFYLENYGVYASFIKNEGIIIESDSINIDTWKYHIKAVLNILKDGIETDVVQNSFVTVRFKEIDVDLTLLDYFFNLQMWYLIVVTKREIRPCHLIFEEGVTQKTISNFINKYLIDEMIGKVENIYLNNYIDDCLYGFRFIDDFSFYLSNTLNIYDFKKLMDNNDEFKELLNYDLTKIPLYDTKDILTKNTNRVIDIIKESDHSLKPFFLSQEGLNIKQFQQSILNKGTVPDGKGNVYPVAINNSYMQGDNSILGLVIEECNGRLAQIIVDSKVGESGSFGRILGLNNVDTFLNEDPDYVCDTKNFQIVTIKDEYMLKRFRNRYYRLKEKGLDYLITEDSTELIGKTIFLRSPMTCASNARGKGICYKCYGKLAYINNDINIGKISAELISAILTQRMLSAKHLLDAKIKSMKFSKDFFKYFNIDYNLIKLQENVNFNGYELIIDRNDIILEDDYDIGDDLDDEEYSEYITNFSIKHPDGSIEDISNENNLYLTNDLLTMIRKNNDENEEIISVPLSKIEADDDFNVFALEIKNNDLVVALKKTKNIINKLAVVKYVEKEVDGQIVRKDRDRHEWLRDLNDVLREGGLVVDSIHGEIILSNQIRSKHNILLNPRWENPNEEYEILPLFRALLNHPSVTVSLSYQYTKKALCTPLTYDKTKPSVMDLFFMEQPQNFIESEPIEESIDDDYIGSEEENLAIKDYISKYRAVKYKPSLADDYYNQEDEIDDELEIEIDIEKD